jgi:hypothetical protein
MLGSRHHQSLEAARINAFRVPGAGTDRLQRFIDEVTRDYLFIQPQIEKARQKLAEARALTISRAEVMRVMALVVRTYSERDFGRDFSERISAIWNNPHFDEQFTFECDPLLDMRAQGTGPALADAIYFLLPDLLLAALEKRVHAIVPRSAKGTLSEKRKAVAEAETHLSELEHQSSDLLSQYRMLLDDKLAVPGQQSVSPESDAAIAAEPIYTEESAESEALAEPATARQSGYLIQNEARRMAETRGIPIDQALRELTRK